MMPFGPGDRFKTIKEAAKDWGKTYNGKSIIERKEMASRIYKVEENGKTLYSYGEAATGTSQSSTPSGVPEGREAVAEIHSHGAYDAELGKGNDQFSNTDIKGYEEDKQPGYVATPDGALQEYDPSTNKTTVVSTDLPSDVSDPNRKIDISPATGKSASEVMKENNKVQPTVQDNTRVEIEKNKRGQ